MRRFLILLACLYLNPGAQAQQPPLLPEPVVAALAAELSGEAAKRNLEFISRHHRTRGSSGFRAAAEHIAAELRSYGLTDVVIEEIPADGKTFYGTQKARMAWDAEFAELWELRRKAGAWEPAVRLASWEAMPLTLAQDSESADVVADLVDVGEGTSESDYAGKDVRGKIVLVAAQPEAVQHLAVERFGAAGMVSYAQNQRTAWWGENENLVRWGHLESFAATPSFGFMVTLKQARSFRERLSRGETIRLHAVVRAGRRPGFYSVVLATIPGSDPVLGGEEIAFSCHIDHPRPGANDNASGCVTLLEVARTFAKLTREGKLAPPKRTLRFIWPPEIEGTMALLHARPELASRIQAVVHMDMVGGGPETKAIFHVTRGPASLPSFVNDVAEAFGEFVNQQSAAYASGGTPPYPLVALEGGKEALQADFSPLTLGSDHQVYGDSSFAIPAIYLNDWPDRYIHTNFDSPANIDPTKLKRAGFIGAAAAYFLANAGSADAGVLWSLIQAQSLSRTASMLERRQSLEAGEAANLTRFHFWHERRLVESMERFLALPDDIRHQADEFFSQLEMLVGAAEPAAASAGEGRLVFRRNPAIKGPLSAFGYDYLEDHYGKERAGALRLAKYRGLYGAGGDYIFETLNFVDGRRTAQEIRDAVSAVYGPVPLELVVEFLQALEEVKMVERIPD